MGTEEVGLAAMEGWQWAPSVQQGVEWNLNGGPTGDGGTQQGSLEGVDSLPEAMAKSKQEASRRVSRANSRQFERMASQVSQWCHAVSDWCIHCPCCKGWSWGGGVLEEGGTRGAISHCIIRVDAHVGYPRDST